MGMLRAGTEVSCGGDQPHADQHRYAECLTATAAFICSLTYHTMDASGTDEFFGLSVIQVRTNVRRPTLQVTVER